MMITRATRLYLPRADKVSSSQALPGDKVTVGGCAEQYEDGRYWTMRFAYGIAHGFDGQSFSESR